MDALVTFDVSGKQDEVRALMLARGYHDCGTPPNPAQLLEATLWRKDTGLLEALQDIKAAANECQVTLQKAVVLPSGR